MLKKSHLALPFWLLRSMAELACLLNILCPPPPSDRAFHLRWWYWRRASRMAAIRSRYRNEPDLLSWLSSLMQLRL